MGKGTDETPQVLNLSEKICPNTFLRTSMDIAIGTQK